MNDLPIIETKLDDASLIRLAWTESGGLSIQRYVIANLRDGHGYLLQAQAHVDAEKASGFAAACRKSCGPHPTKGCEQAATRRKEQAQCDRM